MIDRNLRIDVVRDRLCCKSGEFLCEKPVLYHLGRNRLIYVDSCIIPELQSLWNRGIETCGCCCGHGKNDGFIQVLPEYVDAMKDLGYEEIPPYEVDGKLYGEHCFKSKTKFEFNGYMDVRTDLEKNYEKLANVSLDMLETIVASGIADHPVYFPKAVSYKETLESLGIELD